MRARAAIGIGCVVATLSCGPWQRVGAPDKPAPGTAITRALDAGEVYRQMGFFATGAPLPFVGAVRWLAGRTADSTLGLISLSLANHALSFHRDGNEFIAEYRVEVSFRRDSEPARLITSDQSVRVRSFQETLRSDESVIFQQFVTLRHGPYTVGVFVRDRNGPAYSRQERGDTVPRLAGMALAEPVPIYEGIGRSSRDSLPRLVVNPRATLPYGGDTLRFYVEAYGLAPGTPLIARALNDHGVTVWAESVATRGGPELGTAIVRIPPGRLPVGLERLDVVAPDTTLRAAAPFLVSFSGQWVVTNWNEMVSLLRYYDRQDLVAKLRSAPDSERPKAWQAFWSATDPVPITPENEALDDYFRRIQIANQRFQESTDPGWLTDRGEVFITIGEPDETYDMANDYSRTGVHALRWIYTNLRLDLLFVDQTGFGRYRMTPGSRADFERVASRVLRAQ